MDAASVKDIELGIFCTKCPLATVLLENGVPVKTATRSPRFVPGGHVRADAGDNAGSLADHLLGGTPLAQSDANIAEAHSPSVRPDFYVIRADLSYFVVNEGNGVEPARLVDMNSQGPVILVEESLLKVGFLRVRSDNLG